MRKPWGDGKRKWWSCVKSRSDDSNVLRTKEADLHGTVTFRNRSLETSRKRIDLHCFGVAKPSPPETRVNAEGEIAERHVAVTR